MNILKIIKLIPGYNDFANPGKVKIRDFLKSHTKLVSIAAIVLGSVFFILININPDLAKKLLNLIFDLIIV